LEHLVLVAGHAVYVAKDFDHPERDERWLLQPFQHGEPPHYIEHIRTGVALAAADERALLVFSGGQTRREAGPRSEGQSYWDLAQHFAWWSHGAVRARATVEEFARDSFENLLFGICRFREVTGGYPHRVSVVSWAFKARRFQLHCEALRFPDARFHFHGVNQPADLSTALRGEDTTIAAFRKDPYGAGLDLSAKRAQRNPFEREPIYPASCPELADLLRHHGPQPYEGAVPWS
jgi:hypothetical protein